MQHDKFEKKKSKEKKGGGSMQKCIACYSTLQVGRGVIIMLFLLLLSADNLCRRFV